jgi:hypothetical protein
VVLAVVGPHTRRERAPIDRALAAVEASFAAQPAWPRLETELVPVDDVIAPDDLNRFADTLYAVVRGWLLAGVQVRTSDSKVASCSYSTGLLHFTPGAKNYKG